MRNAALYILIRFASQGVVFAATLLIARMLPLEAFASIGMALLLQAVLVPLSGLSLHAALERFFFTYDRSELPGKIFSIWLASLAINGTLAVLTFCVIAIFHLNFVSPWQSASILIATVLQSAQYVPSVVMRCREQLKVFAAMQMIFVLLTQVVIVAWIYVDQTVDAWFYGTLVGSFAAFLMWLLWVLAETRGRRLLNLYQEIKYVWPVVPIGVLEAAQQTSDRYILQATAPAADFASYSLGQRFASPIATLASGAKSAIYPIIYRSKSTSEAGDILAATTNPAVAAFGVLTCVAACAMAVVIDFFLAPEYVSVYPLFLAIAAGLFIRGQEVLLGVGPDVTMQQRQRLKVLAPILILQIAIGAALTFAFGLMGAAASYLLNSIARTGAMAVLGQRLLPRTVKRIDYWMATLATLMALLTIGLGAALDGPAGPALLTIIAPVLVLAYLLRKGA